MLGRTAESMGFDTIYIYIYIYIYLHLSIDIMCVYIYIYMRIYYTCARMHTGPSPPASNDP